MECKTKNPSRKRRKTFSPYSYAPIPNEGYLRYLILDPAKANQSLSGSLVVKHINDDFEFDAISYVWGNPKKVDRVTCDGKSIGITASLRDALRRVRLPDTPRNIWADQICIDQSNLEERSNQVKLMGKVYEKSSTTLLWLGDAPDSDVEDIQSLVTEANTIVRPDLSKVDGDWEKLPAWPLTDPIFNDERWFPFAEMTRCAWFQRVWIVQEAGLSKNPLIMYGDHNFEWEDWNMVLSWISHRGSSIAADFDVVWNQLHVSRAQVWASAKSETPSTTKTGMDEEEEWSLPEILHSARYLRATDPRDHVYAFLGHSSATHPVSKELILTPDYTVNASKVYFDFAVRWIEWTKDLTILSYVQHESEDAIKKDPPSWVPVWNTKFAMNSISTNLVGGFSAGMNLQAVPQIINKTCLQVKGIVFDTLKYTSEILEDEDFRWGNEISQESKTVNKWKDILSHILCSSPEDATKEVDSLLKNAFTPFFCGSLSGYASDADKHVAAFILSRITLCKTKNSPSLLESIETISAGSDPHLVESDCGIALGRRFAISQAGLYALAPPGAREGDLLCVVFGASTPFIIRPVLSPETYYQLVGEAFVSGVMDGKIVERCEKGEFEEQDIVLV